MRKLKIIYNRASKQTQNRLQEIFDTFNFTFDTLYSITDTKTKNRINVYIEEWKEKGLLKGYFGTLAKNIYSRAKVKNSEILELLIYSAYIEEQEKIKDKEQQIMYADANYYYQEGQKEVNKTLKDKKAISIMSMALFLALLDQPNVKGFTFEQYIEITIRYKTEQILRQATIDLQQQNELNITNNIYQDIFRKQANSRLTINKTRAYGDIDLHQIGINNQAKLQGMLKIDVNAKCKFIAVEDSKTTKMCKSLDGQMFYVHKLNKFERYSKSNDCVKKYKCYGLIPGLNLPPINDNFHYCRSTITYQV